MEIEMGRSATSVSSATAASAKPPSGSLALHRRAVTRPASGRRQQTTDFDPDEVKRRSRSTPRSHTSLEGPSRQPRGTAGTVTSSPTRAPGCGWWTRARRGGRRGRVQVQTRGLEVRERIGVAARIVVNRLDREAPDFFRDARLADGRSRAHRAACTSPSRGVGASRLRRPRQDEAFVYADASRRRRNSADLVERAKDGARSSWRRGRDRRRPAHQISRRRARRGLDAQGAQGRHRAGTIVPVLCAGRLEVHRSHPLLTCSRRSFLARRRGDITGTDVKAKQTATRSADPSSRRRARVQDAAGSPHRQALALSRDERHRARDSTLLNPTRGARERWATCVACRARPEARGGLGPARSAVAQELKETLTGDTLTDEATHSRYRASSSPSRPQLPIQPKTRGDEDKISTRCRASRRRIEPSPPVRPRRPSSF